MGAHRRLRSRQGELFPRSLRPVIPIAENHSKVTSDAGRPPHLRALTGALVLRATRRMTCRETEDQIRHYAPARYLCGLTETEWTPDANTIHDFEQLLGEDGIRQLNEYVVKWAVQEKLADPTVVVADTTAQEAAIAYPNEMGLMATFLAGVVAAAKKVGPALQGFLARTVGLVRLAKSKLREYRLRAQDKSKAAKDRMVAQMATVVEGMGGARRTWRSSSNSASGRWGWPPAAGSRGRWAGRSRRPS